MRGEYTIIIIRIIIDLTNQGFNENRFEYTFMFSIFSLSLRRHAMLISSSYCVMKKSLVMLFLTDMLVPKWEMNLALRS
jgi:hypothetical protein